MKVFVQTSIAFFILNYLSASASSLFFYCIIYFSISTSVVRNCVSCLFGYCIISLSISTSGVRNSASFIFCYCIISLVFEETVSQANSLSPNDKTRLLSA